MRDESVTEQFQRMDIEQREEMRRYKRPLMMMAEEEDDDNTMKTYKLPAKGIFLDLNQVNPTKVPPPCCVLIETQELMPFFLLEVQMQVVSFLRLWNLS